MKALVHEVAKMVDNPRKGDPAVPDEINADTIWDNMVLRRGLTENEGKDLIFLQFYLFEVQLLSLNMRAGVQCCWIRIRFCAIFAAGWNLCSRHRTRVSNSNEYCIL